VSADWYQDFVPGKYRPIGTKIFVSGRKSRGARKALQPGSYQRRSLSIALGERKRPVRKRSRSVTKPDIFKGLGGK
jgi:hypothetical protein